MEVEMCAFQHFWRRKCSINPGMFPIYSSVKVCSAFGSVTFIERHFLLPVWATWIEQTITAMQNVWWFLIIRHLLIKNRVNLPTLQETQKSTASPQAALYLFAVGLAVNFSTVYPLWNRTISSVNLVASPMKYSVKITVIFRQHRRYDFINPEEVSTCVDYLQIGLLSMHK